MILGTLQCRVYGKVITKWANEMRLTKDSGGKPKWYDFGKQYDNVTIEATITAESGVELEALVREQNLDETIEVVWEDGEWLYGYTGGFTIQTFESIGRVDKDLSEWGYKITFGSIEPIDFTLLTGDRTQCSGAGYIQYSNTLIPQPKEYGFQYHTEKYTGMTHGSSFSAEMPTIEHDSTSFKATVLSGNMRSLLDDITAHRGLQFFVTFPDSCYPFGISQGNGQFTCVPSKRDYTVTNENGDWYSIDIGLYNYIPVVPGPGTPFYEAPLFTESDWSELVTNGSISFDGSTATLTGNTAVVWDSIYSGKPETAEVHVSALGSNTNRITHIMNLISANDRAFIYYDRGADLLHFVSKKNGVDTDRTHSLGGLDTLKTVGTVACSGADWTMNAKIYDSGDNLLFDIDETFIGGCNPAVDYFLRMQGQDGAQTYTYMRVNGDGYPYTE